MKKFGSFALLRWLVRYHQSIDLRLAEQNRLLHRLANHFAPERPAAPPVEDRAIDHLNQTEAALVLQYVDRIAQSEGRAPTEEEVMAYLASEESLDLQQRLNDDAARTY